MDPRSIIIWHGDDGAEHEDSKLNNSIPIITIDGPSGSGKGTIARSLSKKLHWHLLDSGAVYRAFAYMALQQHIDPSDHVVLNQMVKNTQFELSEGAEGDKTHVIFDGVDISPYIRTEECSAMASKISAIPFVRDAVTPYLRKMCREPGLIADGRDMGTVIFPAAQHKFFLIASADERARRRQNQLIAQGIAADFNEVLKEINERDRRDQERDIAPAKPAEDAVIVDTTHVPVEEVLAKILKFL